jgi:hypothetical protein
MAEAVEVAIEKDEVKPVEVALDDKKGEQKIVTADEGIEDLKAQVERSRAESKARLEAANRQIQEAVQAARSAEQREIVAKRDHVGTIMEKLAADKDSAKRDLKAAHEAGDFDRVAEAQDRLSMANARIVEAERGKMALDEDAKAAQQGRNIVQQQNDPVESYAKSIESSNPRSAAWIRQHPEVIVNGQVSPRAMSAHYAALDEGLQPDSDAYLDRLDAALTGRRTESRQETRQNGGRSPTSAPVNRDVAHVPGSSSPGTVRLNKDEVQNVIDTLGPLYPDKSTQELCKIFVKNREDLIREGRMGGRA